MGNLAIAKNTADRLPFWRIFVFGLGNLASQLSWAMVSSYMSIFYTDVIGLSAASVATMLVVARIYDAVDDPFTGLIMERTHTRWGRFRPWIFIGAPLLAIMTILTFRNPGLGPTGNLVYAYITYLLLGLAYSIVNIPYMVLPMVISKDRNDMTRLGAANMVGMNAGMIILNLITMNLITFFANRAGGNTGAGYQTVAIIYGIIAMFIFWAVFAGTKEVVQKAKENNAPWKTSIKLLFTSRNIMCDILYGVFFMLAMMGRIGIAVYYYIYVVRNIALVGLFMSLGTIVGIAVAPVGAYLANKIGRKKTIYIGLCLHIVGLTIMLFAPDATNIPYQIIAHIIYGLGYIAGASGTALLRDAVDEVELKTGVRIDGTASAFSQFSTKAGGAIGTSLGLVVIGIAGYVGGQEVTPTIANGINFAANALPIIFIVLAMVPLALYNITESKGQEIHRLLSVKQSPVEAAMTVETKNI